MMLMIPPVCAFSQNTFIHSSSFNSGYAEPSSSVSTVRSALGQSFVGTSFEANSIVESGFLADTLLRGLVLSVKDHPAAVPRSYELKQNYPNPFNPLTVIRYSLSGKSYVVLNVYDVLGRVVARLVNEQKEAGEYTLNWNASNEPSGVYFYRLTTVPLAGNREGFVATRKMALVR